MVKPPGGVPVQRQHPLAAAGFLPARIVLRDLHIGPFSQEAYRVRECQVFYFHHELEGASPLMAAEAIKDLSNQKGRVYDKFRNRLMFPVIDVRGDVVAFGGRVLDKSEPKYMNTTETIVYSKRRNLYGINLAKKTKRPNFILCEGNIDVITLHQAGFDNAVASMGTALTTEQTKILSRYTKELVLCFDNDTAGQMATQKNIEMLKDSEFAVRPA